MDSKTNYSYPMPDALRKVYRTSLCRLGLSTTAHLYDLPHEYLEAMVALPEGRFLLSMQEYYSSLNRYERRILLSEFLERGLFYRFWYVADITDDQYRKDAWPLYRNIMKEAKKEGLL